MWDRLLWGIEFSSPRSAPILIGDAWLVPMSPGYYDDEPTRALLFCTRSAARRWCDTQHAKYAGRNDCCAQWRFRAVHVRERVAKDAAT